MAGNNNYEKSTRQSHDHAIKKQTTDNNSRHSISPHVSGDSRRASGKTRTSDKAKLPAADKKKKTPSQ